MVSVNLNRDGIGRARRRIARSAAEPPFPTASTLGSSRARVSYVNKSALRRGTRRCPWIRPRPRRRRVSPATSVSLVFVALSRGFRVSVSPSHISGHCVADPLLFLKNSYLEFYRSKWHGSNLLSSSSNLVFIKNMKHAMFLQE